MAIEKDCSFGKKRMFSRTKINLNTYKGVMGILYHWHYYFMPRYKNEIIKYTLTQSIKIFCAME